MNFLFWLTLLFSFPLLAATDEIVALESMTVTGTSIKQTESSHLLPIKTYSTKDIKQTGARTSRDLLKYIPEIDYSDTDTQNGLTTTAGASYIKLRGLSARNTLVLLNGQRLSESPIQEDQGNGAAVDINLIPLSAIERIEILKNGSSAIYGADAVAGVVNFITKRDFQGANLMGNYGISAYGDGSEKQTGFSIGKGDLEQDHYNGMVVFEYYNRDPIYRADRDLTKSVDFRRFGGLDLRSTSAPQGNVISGPNAGKTETPCPASNLNGTSCRYDYNALPSTMLLGTERWNMFANGTIKLTNTTLFHSQFLYSNSQVGTQNHPIPDAFTLPNGDVIRGRFMQGGNRYNDKTTELYQLSGTLEGEIWGQFWDVTVGYSRSDVTSLNGNYFLRDQLNVNIKSGLINPTVTTNDQALIDALKIQFNDPAHTSLTYANAKLTGDLWARHGMNLDYAGGFQWRHETMNDTPDEITRTPQIAGGSALSVIDAARDVFSGFGELKFNLAEQLQVQTAVRYDSYTQADNISPQVAVAYTPDDRISIRGNWGQNFLVPTFRQLYGSGTTSSVTLSGANCALIGQSQNCAQQGKTISTGNPNLKPENGESWNIGLDLHPWKNLTASFDYWRIAKTNEIIRPTYLDYLKQGLYRLDNNSTVLFDVRNENWSHTLLEGIDVGSKLYWKLGTWGKLTFADNLTYYLTYNVQQTATSATETRLGYAADLPTWRNVFSLTWDLGPWSSTIYVRSTAGFKDSYNYPTTLTPAANNIADVSAYTEADFLVGYKGIKKLDLNMGVKNFTNAMPPFSSAASQRTSGFAYAPLYDSRGAYFFLTANYHFDF